MCAIVCMILFWNAIAIIWLLFDYRVHSDLSGAFPLLLVLSLSFERHQLRKLTATHTLAREKTIAHKMISRGKWSIARWTRFYFDTFVLMLLLCATYTNTHTYTLYYLLQWPLHDHWIVQLNKTTTTKEMPPPSQQRHNKTTTAVTIIRNNKLIERHNRQNHERWNCAENCKCHRWIF